MVRSLDLSRRRRVQVGWLVVSLAYCLADGHCVAALRPYDPSRPFGPRFRNDDLRFEFPSVFFEGVKLSEYFPIYQGLSADQEALDVEIMTFTRSYGWSNRVSGRVLRVSNPIGHVSVVEPLAGCGHGLYRVSDTAKSKGCQYAVNAGFFDIHNGDCLGNVVSDGSVVQNTGIQNANFGITRSGRYLIGYLSEAQVSGDDGMNDPPDQIVAGVIWVIRNASVWIEESAKIEDMSTQTTGSEFLTAKSARVAIGHDSRGRLLIVEVDGKTWERGLTLAQLADLLLEFDAVNAINLDGGGSATFVSNGTVTNVPSDECDHASIAFSSRSDEHGVCERPVSSVICLHSRSSTYLSVGGTYSAVSDGWTSTALMDWMLLFFLCVVGVLSVLVNFGVLVAKLRTAYLRNRKRKLLAPGRELRQASKRARRETRRLQRRERRRSRQMLNRMVRGRAVDEGDEGDEGIAKELLDSKAGYVELVEVEAADPASEEAIS